MDLSDFRNDRFDAGQFDDADGLDDAGPLGAPGSFELDPGHYDDAGEKKPGFLRWLDRPAQTFPQNRASEAGLLGLLFRDGLPPAAVLVKWFGFVFLFFVFHGIINQLPNIGRHVVVR